jgi:hypothetical protein
MRGYLFLLLFVAGIADAANGFIRAHDADSVVLGPICVPEFAGPEFYDVDYDTTGLTITIYASGDGVDTSYTYTGANIDDYDGTPPAWGNPAASAVEVEDDDECIRLHIRDEVFAISGATEWTIKFTDGANDNIMDYEVVVSTHDGIWERICEPNGSRQCGDILAWLLSEAMGECDYNTGTSTYTCSDPEGTGTRFQVVYGTDPGDRTSSTLTTP